MAFDGAYTLTQSSPSTISLQDASTGSDATITGRRIYLYTYNNGTIVPSDNPAGQTWIDWLIGDTSITLTDILDRDYCLNITVVWVTPTPTTGDTYTVNHAYCFKQYSENFMDGLIQTYNVGQPNVVNSTMYVSKWGELRLYVDSAFEIVDNTSDVMNGQLLLNKAYDIIINETKYF